MNPRFTKQAQEAIQQAHEVLQQYQHTQLDVEHILLTLLRQQDSTVARILQMLNVDTVSLTAEIEEVLNNVAHSRLSNNAGGISLYITMRVKRLFELAPEEAHLLGDSYISTEHLFLAAVDERTGVSVQLLAKYGISKEKVYYALRELRRNGVTEQPAAEATSFAAQGGGFSRWGSRVSQARPGSDNSGQMVDMSKQLEILTMQIAGLHQQM